ncbi:MAG TPA: MSMEG_0569 family flavin-dependent oxidoreductase [Solirubrobacteraceae bacterium]|jgi:putative flavoprotein involved in K+ transport|nr:MSMEG_0569 family flavin-dependent oxidoreductase [Solirubrobacteraceae bacterium]
MPSVEFTLRWPDGTVQRCFSPSTVIGQTLVEGGVYPLRELVRRCRAGLERAGERVREQRGFACTAAAEQLEGIEARARDVLATHGEGMVRVERVRPDRPRIRHPAPEELAGHAGTVVIGGGQAGLAVSYYLRERGVPHVVLERDRLASSWRAARWDTFCLVTPNWQCRLPGYPYAGDDPEGFMVKDEIVSYVEGFASSSEPPLYEGVTVERVEEAQDGGFQVTSSRGELTAEQVILAVGGYHVPSVPRPAAALRPGITQLHSSSYRNPASLPDGAVLVVGSGQSGAQIAEDLHLAGRQVHLSVGSAPRVARFYRGRDCVAWLEDMGHYDMAIEDHPDGLSARREPNHYVTGRDGGHDLDLRAMARDGMHLHGRLLGIDASGLAFSDDLARNLDAADATAERIKDAIDRYISARGIEAPTEPRYAAVWEPAPGEEDRLALGQDEFSTVVWATGFRSDWSWVNVPAFDGSGYPTHHRGVTTVPGLYVLGLPWLHTWGSGRFAGIDRDALHVADRVAAYRTVEARAAA